MKVASYKKYGSPEVLSIQEVETPTPKDNEVLIRIHAAVVTSVDSTFRKGDDFFAKLYTGFSKPKRPILGNEFSGEIVATGKNVSKFETGDQIYGCTQEGFGAHGEYIALSEDGTLAIKPTNLTYEEAAAIAYSSLTALPFLRDEAKVKPGQRVLINGASGAIGTIAVQLAKHLGAEVTGVCSTTNVTLVKSLGADYVIDYKKTDFTKTDQTYDVIFDVVGKSSYSLCKKSLAPKGKYLTTVMSMTIIGQMLWTKMSSKKAMFAATGLRKAPQKIEDLQTLKHLVETNVVKPVIDKKFPLAQIAEAHQHVDSGRARGNVAISI